MAKRRRVDINNGRYVVIFAYPRPCPASSLIGSAAAHLAAPQTNKSITPTIRYLLSFVHFGLRCYNLLGCENDRNSLALF